MESLESRKQKEKELHNVLRDEGLKGKEVEFERLNANKKFYSINRSSRFFVRKKFLGELKNKKVLDYCCGNGEFSIFLAKNGIEAVGVDISDVSIENAKRAALKEGVADKVNFMVMDAENTTFPDDYFDDVACLGVLHHLDTRKAFKELARIVKPEGQVICDEPLSYNPLFQLYRKLTPYLRTAWEAKHILSGKDLKIANQYFGKVETRFFHLFVLLAVPFRNLPIFEPLLKILERLDSIFLRLPLFKWLSWQIVFILSEPKKN